MKTWIAALGGIVLIAALATAGCKRDTPPEPQETQGVEDVQAEPEESPLAPQQPELVSEAPANVSGDAAAEPGEDATAEAAPEPEPSPADESTSEPE